MSKEMIVSCSSHETKIAILEEDQVTELYFERGKEYTLAGSIYKGRVTRVLPGMQSAFVDVGLDRDAFLYVSDFLEDTEEYDRIASTVEEKVIRMEENAPVGESTVAPVVVTEASPVEPVSATQTEPPALAAASPVSPLEKAPPEKTLPPGQPRYSGPEKTPGTAEDRQGFSRRSRRRRPHHKGFPDSKYASRPPAPAAPTSPPAAPPSIPPIILPGESLAKYKSWSTVEPAQPQTERVERTTHSGPAASPAEYPPESFPSGPVLAEAAVAEAVHSEEAQQVPEPIPPQIPVHAVADIPSESGASIAEQVESNPLVWETVTRQVAQGEEQANQAREQSIEPPQAHSVEKHLEPVEEPSQDQSQIHAEEPAFSPDASPVEPSSLTPSGTVPSAVADSSEGSEAESAALKTESAEGSTSEPAMPQRAAVRERHRNPRYMRKGRWVPRKEGRPEIAGPGARPREREAPQPLIADLLKEGQEILVQIAKEPLGKKGARITSHIALPGRYLVYMPTVNHVGVSRKIASDEERQRLKRIILEHGKNIQGGFIVRTAGEGHSEEDLRQDIHYLSKLWAEVKAQAEKSSAPVLLHHDLNLVLRILRDQFSEEFSAVWVDNEQEYERILSLVIKFQPALVNRVKLYSKDVPLFDELGIQEEINKALKPKV